MTVKRYCSDAAGMSDHPEGEYVLHSDYAAVVAERDDLRESLALAAETEAFARARITEVESERDELARALEKGAWVRIGCMDACVGCNRWFHTVKRDGHAPGCPVALAEQITKEAGDGR